MCYSYTDMKNKRYMLDSNSFMPFVTFALIVGGGAFEGLIRNWNWGVLSIPTGVILILAAAALAAVIALVSMKKITGEFVLIPVGLTFIGLVMHSVDMIIIKGSYGMRTELLLAVVFVAMILIMTASLRGRRGFDRNKALIICIVIAAASLFAIFMPLIVNSDGGDRIDILFEIFETNMPLMLYFAAYVCYFAGIEKAGSGEN